MTRGSYCFSAATSTLAILVMPAADGIDWVWEHRIEDLMKVGI